MSTTPITQADLDAHSEQAMIETLYIGTANDVLGSALGGLESALQISTGILQTLNGLQIQKNQLVLSGRSVPTYTGGSTDVSAYSKYASTYFGRPIVPTLASGFNAASVAALASLLGSQLQAFAAIGSTTDPNGLYQQGEKILQDIHAAGGASAWVLDNYQNAQSVGASKAGGYQDDLSLAITASVSLSDTQKEQIRQELFIFEEYYKSAGSMLSTITTVINDEARNISRS